MVTETKKETKKESEKRDCYPFCPGLFGTCFNKECHYWYRFY